MTTDRVKGPDPKPDAHPIRLSAVEMASLMERLGLTVLLTSDEYGFWDVFPVRFWVSSREWQEHNLRIILHNCQAKWKDVLTEPTLVKLRALLAEPKDEPSS